MSSLLEQLPKIVADGKRDAERIMERLESNYRIGLQTHELVIPSRDSNWQDMFAKSEKASQDLNPATMNRLIYGDNLLAMAALLAGDEQTPSLRGKVDLIYIDPPFDSQIHTIDGQAPRQGKTLALQDFSLDKVKEAAFTCLTQIKSAVTTIKLLEAQSNAIPSTIATQVSIFPAPGARSESCGQAAGPFGGSATHNSRRRGV